MCDRILMMITIIIRCISPIHSPVEQGTVQHQRTISVNHLVHLVHLLSSLQQFGPVHEQQISEWIEAEWDLNSRPRCTMRFFNSNFLTSRSGSVLQKINVLNRSSNDLDFVLLWILTSRVLHESCHQHLG